jgi:hypothetical protein
VGSLLVSWCFSREEQLTKLAGRAGISVLAAGKFAYLSAGLAFGYPKLWCGGIVLCPVAREVFVKMPGTPILVALHIECLQKRHSLSHIDL